MCDEAGLIGREMFAVDGVKPLECFETVERDAGGFWEEGREDGARGALPSEAAP